MGRTADPRWIGPEHMASHVGEVAHVASSLAAADSGHHSDGSMLMRPGLAAGHVTSSMGGGEVIGGGSSYGGGSIIVAQMDQARKAAGSPYALGLEASVSSSHAASEHMGSPSNAVIVPLAGYNPQTSPKRGLEPNAGGVGVGGLLGLPVQLSRGDSMGLLAASLASTTMPRLEIQAFGLHAARRHRTRITVRELKSQSINATTHAVLSGRGLMYGYSNADIAQYAILVTIFAKHAEQEWITKGGMYLSGRGTSHEFVGHVVRRVIAEYSSPAYPMGPAASSATLPPTEMVSYPLAARASHDGASDIVQPVDSVVSHDSGLIEEAIRVINASSSMGTGSVPDAGSRSTHLEAGSSLAHDGKKAPAGTAPAASTVPSPIPAQGFQPVDLINSRSLAFASLPALLGDVWNESFLALIYHYYVRANQTGAPPAFGQLDPEESKKREEACRRLAAFRDLIKTLRDKRKAAMADKAAATAAKQLSVEAIKKAARRAARKMVHTKAQRAEAAHKKLQEANAALRKLVIRRKLAQDAKSESVAKARRDVLKADAAVWRQYAGARGYEMELREAMLAEEGGLNPLLARQKHVRRTLQALQTSVIDQLESKHKRLRKENGIVTPLPTGWQDYGVPLLTDGAAASMDSAAFSDGYVLQDAASSHVPLLRDVEEAAASDAEALRQHGSVLWDTGDEAATTLEEGVGETHDEEDGKRVSFVPRMTLPSKPDIVLPSIHPKRVTISQESIAALASRHGRRFNASRGLNVKLLDKDGVQHGAHA